MCHQQKMLNPIRLIVVPDFIANHIRQPLSKSMFMDIIKQISLQDRYIVHALNQHVLSRIMQVSTPDVCLYQSMVNGVDGWDDIIDVEDYEQWCEVKRLEAQKELTPNHPQWYTPARLALCARVEYNHQDNALFLILNDTDKVVVEENGQLNDTYKAFLRAQLDALSPYYAYSELKTLVLFKEWVDDKAKLTSSAYQFYHS